MADYEKVRVTRNRYNVIKDGVLLCQLTAKEVDAWISRARRNDAFEAEYAMECRARRIEIAREYLVRRAARVRSEQFELF